MNLSDMTEASPAERGIAARIGICMLNLLAPGLGLVRLAQYRAGLTFVALGIGLVVAVVTAYVAGLPSTATGFLIAAGAIVCATPLLMGLSIVLTWRNSRQSSPRTGHLWRWYGVVGLLLATTMAGNFVAEIGRAHFRGFSIASQSMAPTLRADDIVMAQLRNHRPIQRGDLVVSHINGEDRVYRVAAIGGDRFAMRDGIITLNGQQVAQQDAGQVSINDDGFEQVASQLHEQLPGEARSHLILSNGATDYGDFGEVEIAPGHYFLLGDNRDNSADSRFDRQTFGIGIVAEAEIVGVILYRYWRRASGWDDNRL